MSVEASSNQRPRLLDEVRAAIRCRGMSRRTEKAYVGWIRRFILFHDKRHPADMGADEATQFLTSLAVDAEVAPATQNQALAALLFLYRVVLRQELPWLDDLVRAKRPRRLPVALSRAEVRAVLAQLTGTPRLLATLLYGSGLRLLEALQLRIKDLDFGAHTITVRAGKGNKDRVTVLPKALATPLMDHLDAVKKQHDADLRRGAGWVELPHSLGRKVPNGGRDWRWQWVFPATRTYKHGPTGQRRRHHSPPAPTCASRSRHGLSRLARCPIRTCPEARGTLPAVTERALVHRSPSSLRLPTPPSALRPHTWRAPRHCH